MHTLRVVVSFREKLEKLKELREEKNKFSAGMWNVNSVMMGGLGRDPDVEGEEEDVVDRQSKATSEAESKSLRSGRSNRIAVSRRSSRREDSDVSPRRVGK